MRKYVGDLQASDVLVYEVGDDLAEVVIDFIEARDETVRVEGYWEDSGIEFSVTLDRDHIVRVR